MPKDIQGTELKKCYVLSADFTAHHDTDIQKIKKEFGVDFTIRLIPSSAIEEVKKRLLKIKESSKTPEKYTEAQNIVFFSPLTIKVNTSVDGKEVMLELARCEIDSESFLDGQKPERRGRA